jgi:outer membrane biosynthesis protein TonB
MAMVEMSEVFVPAAVYLGALGYTIYQDDKNKADASHVSTPAVAVVKPVPEPEPEPVTVVEPEPVAVVKPKPVAVVKPVKKEEPVPAPKEVPAPAKNLAFEVGKTVQEIEEMQDRVEARRAAAASAAAAVKEEKPKEVVAAAVEEKFKPNKRKREVALRILKKAVAPWRKWSEIQ